MTRAAGDERQTLNGIYRLEDDDAAALRVGAEVSVVSTRIFSTALSVTPLAPYR